MPKTHFITPAKLKPHVEKVQAGRGDMFTRYPLCFATLNAALGLKDKAKHSQDHPLILEKRRLLTGCWQLEKKGISKAPFRGTSSGKEEPFTDLTNRLSSPACRKTPHLSKNDRFTTTSYRKRTSPIIPEVVLRLSGEKLRADFMHMKKCRTRINHFY